MLKYQNVKKLFIIILLVIPFAIVCNIPIFEVYSSAENIIKEIANDDMYENICIVKHTYTTGAGWLVIDCNNPVLLGQNVSICNKFDPRLLKDNNEFDLDYQSELVVVVDSINDINIDGENIKVIYPKKIIILYDTKKKYYKLCDMSVHGILKSILGCFNKKYMLSY